MTLLFFLKPQPYPPHPYEEREKPQPKKKKRKARKEKVRAPQVEIPYLPDPATMAEVAKGLGFQIETLPRFEGPDWEKILREALANERWLNKLRAERDLIELLTIIDAEMEL